MDRTVEAIDPQIFRKTLSHYPTGVCVVTAMTTAGMPAGMTVGSFTSVSLNPPLVGFFPAKSATSWPLIEPVGRFCVNVLAHDQQDLCKAFSMSGGDKFSDIEYMLSPGGQPVLPGVKAWIDCVLYKTYEAGDHLIVLGEVTALEAYSKYNPLLFYSGGYGQFAALLGNA